MAENQKYQCTGNCLNCLPAQRAYCASQHAYSNMKVLDTMMGIVIGMQESIKVLGEKVDAIQDSNAAVFDPSATAQEGDGVL